MLFRSKSLATIICDVPCDFALDSLTLQSPDDDKLKALLIEFEFNTIGRRIFGEGFKPGRGFEQGTSRPSQKTQPSDELALVGETGEAVSEEQPAPAQANLKTISDVPHQYQTLISAADRTAFIKTLLAKPAFSLSVKTTSSDPKDAGILGFAFSFEAHTGTYLPLPTDSAEAKKVLEELRGF